MHDTHSAAQILGQSTRTLENYRRLEKGPSFIRKKNRIFYTQEALDEWLRENPRPK